MIERILKLIPPLYAKPNMIAFMRPFVVELDRLIETAKQTIEGWTLNNAVGKQLDAIALEAGIYRGELNDEDLRRAIRAAFIANSSHGTKPEITAVLGALFATDDVQIYQRFPAGISIQVQGALVTDDRLGIAIMLLKRAVGAGVDLGGLWTQDGPYFSWLGDTNANAAGWDGPWMKYRHLG